MIISKNNKTIEIIRRVKVGTKRVFFFPIQVDGERKLRINKTNFARQYDAVALGMQYLNR